MKLHDLRLKLDDVMKSHNISDKLDEEQLVELGMQVVDGYESDEASRADWTRRNEGGLKLAMQIADKKTFPWEGASDVKFPLMTIAAMQYHSRAYPALVDGPVPVACRIMMAQPQAPQMPQQPPPGAADANQSGQQPSPEMQAYQQAVQQITQQAKEEQAQYSAAKKKAERVAEHMSYQILEEDVQWEEETDKVLLIQSLLGCCFKKTYYDPLMNVNRSECVSPRDLVTSYYTKHLDTSPRYTHIIPMDPNTIHERQVMGIFNETPEGSQPTPAMAGAMAEKQAGADDRSGVHTDGTDKEMPPMMLEQYCWYDFDGDGYKEPYIVTVRFDTKQVMRVVARFTEDRVRIVKGKVARIEPIQIFTKYPFIPSPDNGFYDLGFSALLGPVNHSIDTILNQLIDAGSLACAGGGFLGRGFKGRKGEMRFKLGEWKTTESTGDDLRKSIYPLPAKEPSNVLFELLTLLIEYGQQIAGSTDQLAGKAPGQNTPAETSRNTLEQGMKVFNGIYKRTHRAFTQELRKLYELNKIFLSHKQTFFKGTGSAEIFQADYNDPSIVIKPAADAFYMSDAQRMNQANGVIQLMGLTPGVNRYEAAKLYLKALKVADPESIFPDPAGPNAVPAMPNPKVQIEQMKQDTAKMKLQAEMKNNADELQLEARRLEGELQKLRADSIKALADAKGVESGHAIAMLEAQIAAKKNHMDGVLAHLDRVHKMMEIQIDAESARTDRMALSAGNKTPS